MKDAMHESVTGALCPFAALQRFGPESGGSTDVGQI